MAEIDAQLDTEIEQIVRKCREGLPDLLACIGEMEATLMAGVSLANSRGMTPGHLESLHRLAVGLCGENRFEDALPVALQLVLHAPQDQRNLFIAATCVQQAGFAREAAALYGASQLVGETAAGAFRLGECLAALGETARAIEAFQAACDLSRGDEELVRLYHGAVAAIERLSARSAA